MRNNVVKAWISRLMAAVLLLGQLAGGALPAYADSTGGQITIAEAIEDASSYLLAESSITDWDAYALAKAGKQVPANYLSGMKEQIKASNGQFSSVTDYARTVLAIKAAGGDPANVEGYNLVNNIVTYDMTKMANQGNNAYAYALIALDSASSTLYADAKARFKAQLLQNQNTDGGWCCAAGSSSSVDMTAMAVTALAPYMSEANVATSVNKAVLWLQSKQLSNGSYSESGENAETTAQVIIAVSKAGIDVKSTGYTKAGSTDPLTALMKFRQSDGGFAHLSTLTSTSTPTNQALQALAAYRTLKPADSSVYDGVRRTTGGTQAGQKASVAIHVEGPSGIIAEGNVQAATGLEALVALLDKSGITNRDIAPEGYVKSINGISGTSTSYWLYNVKRNGAWDYAQTNNLGLNQYNLTNGDELYVYYATAATKVVESIAVTPEAPLAGDPFQVLVKQSAWDWTANAKSVTVASSVYVDIAGVKKTTDAGGVASFGGLPDGTYTMTVTGSVYNGATTLVSSTKQLTIGAGINVSLQVEGPQSPITSGTVKGVNLLDALSTLLAANQIPFQIVNSSFGKYVKTIAGYSDGWSFAVWRQGKLIIPQVGMADFKLSNNDKIVVYFGGYSPPTQLVSSVTLVPALPKANEPFAVIVEKRLFSWDTMSEVTTPASGVQVQIGSTIMTTNEQGVATFRGGLEAGSYTVQVTGYVADGNPKVVRTLKPAVIGGTGYVSVAVEGKQGGYTTAFASGVASLSTGANALAAFKAVLGEANIPYTLGYFGTDAYLSAVDGVKAEGSDGWLFAVKHNGVWDFSPSVGMGAYKLESGDQVLVYYAGFAPVTYAQQTYIVNGVETTPSQLRAGAAFSLKVIKGSYDYAGKGAKLEPAAGVQVSVGSKALVTDSAGAVSVDGLSAGTYPVTVTGYVYDVALGAQAPKVVRSVGTLQIDAAVDSGGGVAVGPTVKISVVADSDRGTIMSRQSVPFTAGDTAYSLLVKTLGQDRVESRGSGERLYVYGVDGLYEKDKGPQSGWTFAVNCTFPGSSADKISLKAGDQVDWMYTLDNGNDVKSKVSCGGANPGSGVTVEPAAVSVPVAVQDGIGKLELRYDNQKPADVRTRSVVVVGADNKMDSVKVQQLKQELQANTVKVERVVGAAQSAVLSDPKEEVKLQIPATAITEEKSIGILELDTAGRVETLSSMYEFTPKGMKFSAPVYIALKAPLEVDNLENLALAWLNEETNQWIPIPAVLDASTGVITGAVDHFTKFAVIDKSKLDTASSASDVAAAIEAAAKVVLGRSEWSDWEAFGLAEAGKAVPSSYLSGVEQQLREKNGVLRNVTDYERMALGVLAAGGNPRSIGGIDLIEKIVNNERMTLQGANGPIFALYVLKKGGFTAPAGAKWNEASLVKWLLEQQHPDGSWSLDSADEPNLDLTAMAILSLSTLQQQSEVKAAVDRAVAWLSQQQQPSGGYKLGGQENSESAAWVLMAQASLGIGVNDGRFTKSGSTTLKNLLSYQQADGSFAHVKGEAGSAIATEQALLALAMYQRALNGAVSQPATGQAQAYADAADISAWAQEYVRKAKQLGLMEGVDGNRFAPKEQLTRAQFVAIALRLLGEAPAADAPSAFADVQPGSWYAGYVAKAAQKGIVGGVTETAFAPDRSMSRQDMALVLARAFKLKAVSGGKSAFRDMADAYAEAVPAIQAVYEQGYMEGDEQYNFMPKAAVTREMAAAVMVRAYEKRGQ